MRHIEQIKLKIKENIYQSKKLIIIITTIVLLVSLILVLNVYLAPKPTCIKGDCYTGFGVMSFDDGTIYAGGFFEGKFHDFGIINGQNESSYEGMWKLGKKHGSGKLIYPDGSIYTGNFINDKKDGNGNFVWPDKTMIYGKFRKGEPEGLAKVILPNGIQLEGIYKNGLIFDGKGIYIYDDGSRYIGEWEDGKRNGKGILLDNLGSTIKSGNWKDNEFLEYVE